MQDSKDSEKNSEPEDSPKSKIKRFAPLIVLVTFVIVAFSQGWHKYFTLEQLAIHRETLSNFVETNFFLAILAYAGIYIVAVALSLPGGAILTISGGFLFGWLIGGTVTVIAATIGASILFIIAKTSLGDSLANKAGPWLNSLTEGFKADAFNYLLFLRLVPAFPFWLVNLAPALLGVSLKVFVLGTAIGIIPGTFAFSFLGSGLDSVIESQIAANPDCLPGQEDCEFKLELSALVTKELLFALAALGIVALIPIAIKRFKKQ